MSLYRPQLIARLEQANCRPAAVSDSGLEFVDEVLDAWSRLPRAMRCALPERRERSFWYALYTYEDAADAPPSEISNHYLDVQRLQMRDALRLLRANQALPSGYHATRPDELEFLDDFERMGLTAGLLWRRGER